MRKTLSRVEAPGAFQMEGEISVPQLKPRLAVQLAERRHERPGLVPPSPAGLLVLQSGERIRKCVNVGRNVKPIMLEVVPSISNYGQRPGRQHTGETASKLGPSHASRKGKNIPSGAGLLLIHFVSSPPTSTTATLSGEAKNRNLEPTVGHFIDYRGAKRLLASRKVGLRPLHLARYVGNSNL